MGGISGTVQETPVDLPDGRPATVKSLRTLWAGPLAKTGRPGYHQPKATVPRKCSSIDTASLEIHRLWAKDCPQEFVPLRAARTGGGI